MSIVNSYPKIDLLLIESAQYYDHGDPSHDLSHIHRVIRNCEDLAKIENANTEIIVAGAILHDLVNLAKNHPERSLASQMAAEKSRLLLTKAGYTSDEVERICLLILEHSFSLGKKPSSIESAILQDADRLDALGAIGVMRAVTCGSALNATYYSSIEPFAMTRVLDDKAFTIDHFYTKLLKLPALMNTRSGRIEAERRCSFMRTFLTELKKEIEPTGPTSEIYSFFHFTSLQGSQIELFRLEKQDLRSLGQALVSPTTWFSRTRGLGNVDQFANYFSKLLARQELGESLTLIARSRQSNEILATSTFQYPSPGFGKIEIGFTWVADRWQKSYVNSEMKLLMLDYAFNEMKVHRVEFSVHPTNEKSNAAMHRVGASLEGTLRKWRFISQENGDDGNRNLYSIISDEWPTLRKKLNERLSK